MSKASRQRWVIKIGSALLTDNGKGLAGAMLDSWVDQIAELLSTGNEVVVVSSGAVAEGVVRLGWRQRPGSIHELQAAAAVGQMGLVRAYESRFEKHGIHTAQILLVHDDLSSRTRYLNARQALLTLLDYRVVPVVNENDTVATDEIRFGDNDTLAGMVANLIDANLLVILTDQHGVYTADPRTDSSATLIRECDAHDSMLDAVAGASKGSLGRGGMVTKIRAARLASRSGTTTIIASGNETDVIRRLAAGDAVGTRLSSTRKPVAARKLWLAGGLRSTGEIGIDSGAVARLVQSGSSLLPVGVTQVKGTFSRGDLVSCVDAAGQEIARGLINYSSDEARRLIGQPSSKIQELLGYGGDPEIIHRDDLVIL